MQMPLAERGALTVKDLVPGATVDYYSSSKQAWEPIRIKQVDAETGDIELDLRGGTWLKKDAQDGKLRRHAKPQKANLDWIRDTLGSDRFTAEQHDFFKRHAAGHMGEFVVQGDALADLAAELDQQLGMVGSINVLIGEAKPGKSLNMTKFGCAFWKLLHRTLRDHSGAINVKRILTRKGESCGQEYEVEKQLKRGSFGQVYRVRERSTGTLLAVKAISKGLSSDALDAEVEHLCRIDHPNIVKLRRYYEDDEKVYLVMDFCSGGDLLDWIRGRSFSREPTSEELALHLATQLMRGVAHIHTRGILHLDIKGMNVMLTHSWETLAPVRGQPFAKTLQQNTSLPHLMLIDLGVAQLFRPGFMHGAPGGTPSTMSPEMWFGERSPACDIWSCGIVLYEICTVTLDPVGMPVVEGPFEETVRTAQAFWQRGCVSFDWRLFGHLPKSALELVKSMLSMQRQERPSARSTLESEFLRQARPQLAPLSKQDDKVRDLMKQVSKYPTKSVLYKCIALSLALKWPSNQCPTVQKVFSMLDTSGGGLLDFRGTTEALTDLGYTPAAAQAMVKAMDLNKDGFVDWTEFVASTICLGHPMYEPVLEQHFKKAAGPFYHINDRKDLAQLLPGYTERDAEVIAVFDELKGNLGNIAWVDFRGHFAQMSL